jgi:hypothetical protein
MQHVAIHDGNGTWHGTDMYVSFLTDEQLEELEYQGAEHVLTDPGTDREWLLGFRSGDSLAGFSRVLELFLPGAALSEAEDGELIIRTGYVNGLDRTDGTRVLAPFDGCHGQLALF